MKNFTKKLLLLLTISSLIYSCSDDQEFNNREKNSTNQRSLKKDELTNIVFCDDYSYFNLTNGHQMRSKVNLNWEANLQGMWPPGFTTYTIEFQVSYMINGNLVYGTVYEFFETFSTTETIFNVQYNSSQLGGSVSGKWRIKADDCEWSEWKSYY